jgi:2Fe-2S ferredoxin
MTVKLIVTDPAGKVHEVPATPGQSVMRAAMNALIPGIEAACGGNCVCATCHCYVDEEWLARIPPPDETESGMLACTADPRANSRLVCQITVNQALDGLRVQVAASQH